MQSQSTAVDATTLEHYRTHGYAIIRGVVPSDALAHVRRLSEPMVDRLIADWRAAGLIDSDYGDHDFWQRFLNAWRDAGKPNFRRNPNRFLINETLYELLTMPVFLDIAAALLGTHEISVHGIFNSRPQLPHDSNTRTPFHQDSQYWQLDYGEPEPDVERRTHVVTMWFPLQDVDATNGTLEVISKTDTGDPIFEAHDYDYARTGWIGLSPEAIARYPHFAPSLSPGDLLVFDQRTPHGAAPMLADRTRWSFDLRYESTDASTVVGRKFGFRARSARDPQSVTPPEVWTQKRQS
jgi:phytanoyl-CoA hydroxylase